jgi:hypothetical protein
MFVGLGWVSRLHRSINGGIGSRQRMVYVNAVLSGQWLMQRVKRYRMECTIVNQDCITDQGGINGYNKRF